jgi:hypothetical protein
MNRLTFIPALVLLWTFNAMAQQPPAEDLDPEMKKLAEAVEKSTTAEQALDEELLTKLGAKTDEEKALVRRAMGYWQALERGDWSEVYTYFWEPFRQQTPLAGYLEFNKARASQFELASARLTGAECGEIVSYYGVRDPMMDLKRIRARQSWHWEKGNWYLVADPSANPMGIQPPGTKVHVNPCRVEEKISAEKM